MTNLAYKMPKIEIRSFPEDERVLTEKRNNLLSEMETLITRAKRETRELDQTERGRFDIIKKEVNTIDEQLKSFAPTWRNEKR